MIQVAGIPLSLDAGLALEQALEQALKQTLEQASGQAAAQTSEQASEHQKLAGQKPVPQTPDQQPPAQPSVLPPASSAPPAPPAQLSAEQLPSSVVKEIAQVLGVALDDIASLRLVKRSVDARKKSAVHFTLTLELELSPQVEQALLAHAPRGITAKPAQPYIPLSIPACSAPNVSPLVVGAGPAGLFAALYLARAGLCPVLVERGPEVKERQRAVEQFYQTGQLNPHANVQFGEGGAGTFSDGKLTTNTKNPFVPHVLHWFVQAGAPQEILWQAHPHIGSDNLAHVVQNMRAEILQRGGKVLFNTQLVGIEFAHGSGSCPPINPTGASHTLADITQTQDISHSAVTAVQLKDVRTGETTTLPAQHLILACGHSARDTFELCRDAGLAMEQKPFSVGVRIEHPQAFINQAQWGSSAAHPALGAAEYKMAVHLPNGRNVYTFCMCPGGEVVAAASEPGGIVTNGMSNFARQGRNANAAVLVNVNPEDFPGKDVLAGVEFQRSIEQAAYQCARNVGGAPYQAPCQTVGEFLSVASAAAAQQTAQPAAPSAADMSNITDWCTPTYSRGVVSAPLSQCFPAFITEALKEALPLFGRKLKGFDDPRALLTAPETRSSSPVRIKRTAAFEAYFTHEELSTSRILSPDELVSANYENTSAGSACASANHKRASSELPFANYEQAPDHNTGVSANHRSTGLFPCGEGPGFAGGIMSAAVDGLRVAQEVASRYSVVSRGHFQASTSDATCFAPLIGHAPAHHSFQALTSDAVSRNTQGCTLSHPNVTRACVLLRQGKSIIFPTDTLYGLGVSVEHASDPDVLYALKHRKPDKPIAWLVGSPQALTQYGKAVPEWAQTLAHTFWPGPLTIIVKAAATVPASFVAHSHTIGLRMPHNAFALSLLDQLGCPIATTSANISGEAPATEFSTLNPELIRNAAGVFDDQEPKSGVASTVVDCTGKHPIIVRQGAISASDIASVVAAAL